MIAAVCTAQPKIQPGGACSSLQQYRWQRIRIDTWLLSQVFCQQLLSLTPHGEQAQAATQPAASAGKGSPETVTFSACSCRELSSEELSFTEPSLSRRSLSRLSRACSKDVGGSMQQSCNRASCVPCGACTGGPATSSTQHIPHRTSQGRIFWASNTAREGCSRDFQLLHLSGKQQSKQ